MLLYLYADQLDAFPTLKNTMFRDRATQFSDRLKWDVTVDENGHERDEYDGCDPMYLIWRRQNGTHGGSMRLMPTTGPCMVNDHFSHLAGAEIRSPFIWECTRFCLSPDLGAQTARISAAIMLAVVEAGLKFHLKHAVGVFDPRVSRLYRSLNCCPEVIGSSGLGRNKIQVGLWHLSEEMRVGLCDETGITPELSSLWLKQAFDAPVLAEQIA